MHSYVIIPTHGNSLISCSQPCHKQVRFVLIQVYHCETNYTESIASNLLLQKPVDAVYP